MRMKLSFLGAAREVTGSCFLVETADTRFLVDCGMIQGGHAAEARNRKPFAFDPARIDFVLLTHDHIDHSGLLPRLVRSGFKGPIHTTGATAELLEVILPDSAHIQETDALRAARHASGKRPAPPIYTLEDAEECLRQGRPVGYDREIAPRAQVKCRVREPEHILVPAFRAISD